MQGVTRQGKRLVLRLRGADGPLFFVLHLMIAGRLHWAEAGAAVPGRTGLAAFDFDAGTLLLTEAGSKRRAALHLHAALGEPVAEWRDGRVVWVCATRPR